MITIIIIIIIIIISIYITYIIHSARTLLSGAEIKGPNHAHACPRILVHHLLKVCFVFLNNIIFIS